MSRWVYVDLAGSNCGPEFLSVECKITDESAWTDDEIRNGAAHYYDVQLAQIGPVSRRYPPPKPEPALAAIAPEQSEA